MMTETHDETHPRQTGGMPTSGTATAAASQDSTARFDWVEAHHALGHPGMDALHREFLQLCRELRIAPMEQWPILIKSLADHTAAHFAEEERLMRESGFAARDEHVSDHRRVLGQAANAMSGLARGRTLFARAWVANLPDWFATHLATMDSALAAHLRTRSPK